MKVTITTMFKDGIKDNQSEVIMKCLHQLGYTEVTDLKVGGLYIISLENKDRIEEIKKYVTNEIMENGEILDD